MKLLAQSIRNFLDDKVMTLAAALSFYTILSFAPLIILAVWLGGSLGPGAQEAVLQQIKTLTGPGAHDMARSVMESASKRPSLGSLAGAIGILISIVSATTVFAHLQSSLNRIWGIEARPSNAIWGWLRRRVLSVGIIAAITFVLIVSLGISSVLGIFLAQTGTAWDILNQIITIVVFAGLFTLLFRYLPDARLPWNFAIRGGLVTAVMFGAGKFLIGVYLSQGEVGGAYGAAGSLVILLVWVYYSSAIFFFGAEVVQSWVQLKGQTIPLTEFASVRT